MPPRPRRPDPPPLKPAVFYILLALAERDSHGYAVMQTVRDQSRGQVPLRTGSFYRHLSVLIKDGLVAESPRPADPADDDPRRGTYYRLTSRGRQLLLGEKQRLSALVAALDALSPIARRGSA